VLFHVGRSLVLARELAARGHEILFLGSPRYLAHPSIVGASPFFERIDAPDFGPDEGMDILRSIARLPSRARIEEIIEAEVAALRARRPDAVVADFRPTLGISAREAGVPVVSLLLGHWLRRYSATPPHVLRTYPITVLAERALGRHITERLVPGFVDAVVRYKMTPFHGAARARGQRAKTLWEMLEGDLNLVTDVEAWSPTRPLPERFRRTGPIVWEPELPVPPELSARDPGRPRIYVTFGSTGHEDLFLTLFEELSDLPYEVWMTTGGQIDVSGQRVPRNFRVYPFLPAGVMELADLVVYHGGAGTACQVVRAGAPAIVVATHWDQEFAGFATERHRIGQYLTMREVVRRPGRLREAIARVLGDVGAYRERVQALRREFLKTEGVVEAADCVEAFLDERAR
jgi:UDP:flavonoid glycosyltransferase YjiC (YdhE family)